MQEMIQEIQKHKLVVLATSDGESVTARTVLRISDGLNLFCFTGNYTRKYKQMMANPNVAIAAGNLQIEGGASLKGHPLDEENTAFIKAYKKTRPDAYERSSRVHFHRKNVRVIEIAPQRIALYTGMDEASGSESHIDILNIAARAHKA